LIAGCATTIGANSQFSTDVAHWQGRLAVRVTGDTPSSFSANFELQGSPGNGQLVLTTALGTTLARIHWAPGVATLDGGGNSQRFDSLQALTLQAVGTDLPVAGLFGWLQGHPGTVDGWTAHLDQLSQGRLSAQRSMPLPAVELKVALDP
jgi:outer membrane lipoprotein LolB